MKGQVVKRSVFFVFAMLWCGVALSQGPLLEKGQIRFRLNETGEHFVKLTFLNQVWLRYTDMNPGSTVFSEPVSQMFDIGLRRTRLQLFGQLTDKVFFYTQFGQNNFSYLTPRYTGAFFHDAVVEYKVSERCLTVGGGLTGWSGLSRYASPSIGSLLTLDAPLYQQATNGINDQFLRKLSMYAKGRWGKFDYRLALTRPMAVQNATSPVGVLTPVSTFSTTPASLQSQGYLGYQFMDEESNQTPYNTGTYLGKKKVFNVGAGFVGQPRAMWHRANNGDTIRTTMLLLGVDVFCDLPVDTAKGNALTVYAAYNRYDFGKDYLRNVGVMNPANGTNGNGTLNGAGNGFPMIGTGHVFYTQVGYLLSANTPLQPYGASQIALYTALDDPMWMYECGLNWYVHGSHNAKFSLNFQSRPVFNKSGDLRSRKGMVQLQYQVAI
ncbi:MAG: hypothetical protein KDD36_09340 [Flavobacteriales bacterium]|nr:hypothetical protein [Flavobacteriales bacterium]